MNVNFKRHYETNRAPLGLYFHAAWLKKPEFLDAFLFWIEEILEQHDDVYFVTMTQVIEWMQNPKTLNEIKDFEPWNHKCSFDPKSKPCKKPKLCQLSTREVPGEMVNLQTCMRCPSRYPWLNDPTGNGVKSI